MKRALIGGGEWSVQPLTPLDDEVLFVAWVALLLREGDSTEEDDCMLVALA